MERKQRRIVRALGLACGAAPFVFALIRAVTTEGSDTRYFWVALASTAGAAIVLLQGNASRTASIVAQSLAGFVLSTMSAVLAARVLGTSLGPGLLVVATAFGLCSTAGGVLCGRPGQRRA